MSVYRLIALRCIKNYTDAIGFLHDAESAKSTHEFKIECTKKIDLCSLTIL